MRWQWAAHVCSRMLVTSQLHRTMVHPPPSSALFTACCNFVWLCGCVPDLEQIKRHYIAIASGLNFFRHCPHTGQAMAHPSTMDGKALVAASVRRIIVFIEVISGCVPMANITSILRQRPGRPTRSLTRPCPWRLTGTACARWRPLNGHLFFSSGNFDLAAAL